MLLLLVLPAGPAHIVDQLDWPANGLEDSAAYLLCRPDPEPVVGRSGESPDREKGCLLGRLSPYLRILSMGQSS